MAQRFFPPEKCPRCQWYRARHRLHFSCYTRWGTFDVDAAEELARDRRPVMSMSLRSLRYYAARDNWLEDRGTKRYHVPHVDPRKPLIFGTLADAKDGVRFFLLEGHHRGLRHLLEKSGEIPFYLLSVKETESITLRRRHRKPRKRAGRARTPTKGIPARGRHTPRRAPAMKPEKRSGSSHRAPRFDSKGIQRASY